MLKAIVLFTTAACLMKQVEAVRCTVGELQMWKNLAESDLAWDCQKEAHANPQASCNEAPSCLALSQRAMDLPNCDIKEIQDLREAAKGCVAEAGGASTKLISISIVLISSIVYLM